jgi:hypothetical protein
LAGRSPAEAVNAFLEPLQQTLSCVSRAVLDVAGGYWVAAEPHGLTINGGLPAPLRSNHGLGLIVQQQYRIVEAEGDLGPWRISTAAYAYEITMADESRYLAHHWHPAARSPITTPHLHLGGAGATDDPALHSAHIPTGRVALEEVIRMLIAELGVEPLRDDWHEVLYRNTVAFERWRTWP